MQDTAFKLTYSTMFDPPEELHRRFEEALGRREGPARRAPPDADRRRGEARPPASSSRARPSTASGCSRASRAGPRRTWPMPSPRRAPRSGPGRRTPWMERVGDPAPGRGPDRGARLRAGRRDGAGGGQEPPGGAGRGAGDRRPHRAGTARRWRRTAASCASSPTIPLKGYASHNRTVLKPHGVVGGDRAVQLPHGARGRAHRARRSWPATPWSSRWRATRPGAARCSWTRSARRGIPDGVVNYVTGSGAEVGEALVRHPDVAGITFTGSSEVGMGIVAPLRRGALAAAVHRRDGRQEPGHRHAPRGPGARGHPASSAPPSACRGRSAPRPRACSWSGR